MSENEISYLIRGAIFKIHSKLGPGLLESVYETALKYELEKLDLTVKQQVGVPMMYDDLKFDIGFRLDLIVNNSVIIEIKSVETLHDVHFKQLLTYFRLTDKKLGILVNFNASTLVDKVSLIRIVNNL